MATSQVPHNPVNQPKAKSKKFTGDSFYNSTFAITWDIGVVMIGIAIAGLFDPHFLGLNLGYMHCFVLAVFGGLSIWSGIADRQTSFTINLISGFFFLLNAILGFLVGDRGHLKVGYGTSEDIIVKLAPGFLELSVFDHLLHLALAIFMLLEAYSWKRRNLDFPFNLRTRHHRRRPQ